MKITSVLCYTTMLGSVLLNGGCDTTDLDSASTTTSSSPPASTDTPETPSVNTETANPSADQPTEQAPSEKENSYSFFELSQQKGPWMNKYRELGIQVQDLTLVTPDSVEQLQINGASDVDVLIDALQKQHASLSRLTIENVKIDDEQFEKISKLPEIEFLDLIRTNVTQAGLIHLKNMENLEEFNLTTNLMADEGTIHFKRAPNLKKLWISCDRLTNDSVAEFSKLKQIESLIILSENMTKEAEAQLIEALPEAEKVVITD